MVKILVVEDEPLAAMELQDRLESLGYVVVGVVSSGEEAIQKTAVTHPDLVLMDIVLKGDVDGVETAEQIQSRFNIPVVYLTAHSDEGTLQRARITEPYGYILKPFRERELHATIKMAIHKHKMEEELWESEQALRKAQEELELQVEERTAELVIANKQLKEEIEERKRAEEEKEEMQAQYLQSQNTLAHLLLMIKTEFSPPSGLRSNLNR